MSKDKVYPKGLFFNSRQGNQPNFVIGKVSVKCADFVNWLRENHTRANDKGYMYFDVLQGKDDKPYVVLNTFEPKKKEAEPKQDDMPW